MNIQTTTARPNLREALRPHLPSEAATEGATASELSAACSDFLETGANGPYPADMPSGEAREITRDLRSLAEGAGADFREKVGAELRVPQLVGAMAGLEAQSREQVEQLSQERGEIKGAYRSQVVKTIAWMGATAGTLALGLVLPNPVTGIAIAVTAGLTVRSIGKARSAYTEMAARLPQVEANLKVNRQLLADTTFYAPHLQAWNDLLESAPSQQQSAA